MPRSAQIVPETGPIRLTRWAAYSVASEFRPRVYWVSPRERKSWVYGRNRETEVEKGVRQRRERRIDGKLWPSDPTVGYKFYNLAHVTIILNTRTMLMVLLSSWTSHCESTVRSIHLINAEQHQSVVDSQIKPADMDRESAYTLLLAAIVSCHRHIVTRPEADTHFTIPRNVDG